KGTEKTARRKSTLRRIPTRKRLDAGMTESSFSPVSLLELHLFPKLHLGNACKHDLSDAIAVGDAKRRRSQIGQDHPERSAIVAVDRARSVQHRDPMAQRQTRARPHLPFHTPGHGQ